MLRIVAALFLTHFRKASSCCEKKLRRALSQIVKFRIAHHSIVKRSELGKFPEKLFNILHFQ